MSLLSELLKKNSNLYGGTNQSYGIKRYSLPNDAGTYSAAGGMSPAPVAPVVAPVVSPVSAPTVPAPTPTITKPTSTTRTAPAVTPTPTSSLDYSKYMNPATGVPYTPTEYADIMAKRASGGAIPSYVGDSATNVNPSLEELNRKAAGLQGAQTDIGTGATDPYGIASKSGLQYTASDLAAIEKAYAGIYDPALTDVFSKIDAKQKEAADALQLKSDLTKMEQQHKYAMAEKQAPTYADTHAAGVGIGGAYVQGANPAVDAWAQRIFDGTAKITDIPASQKGMRDAVVIALQASGNDLSGKPTVTELGKKAKMGAEELMKKFTSGEGTSAVGKSRLFGGSLAFPGSAKANLVIDFQNLKDMLSLEGVKYLKGQGQVSDAERLLLANAITKLNLSQSEKEFKSTLQGIIDTLSGKETTPGEIDETKASGSNIQTAPDGTLIELTD